MNHRPVASLQPTQKATSRDRMAKDGQGIRGWIVPLPRSPGGEISTLKSWEQFGWGSPLRCGLYQRDFKAKGGGFEMVAGACNHPNYPSTPFEIPLLEVA